MNIIQQHNRVDFWIDKVNSPRFKKDKYDAAINIAINDFINDRYENIKMAKGYAFQTIQKVRDELRTLIPDTLNIAPAADIFQLPIDYLHEVLLQVTISGKKVLSEFASFNELVDLADNGFLDTTDEYPRHIERGNQFEVRHGIGNFTMAHLDYIKMPAIVKRGSTAILPGPAVLTIGRDYVNTTVDTVVHNGVTYEQFDGFTAVNTVLAGAGSVVLVTNCNLPPQTHEEICKMAAQVLTGTVENYDKRKIIKEEISEK